MELRPHNGPDQEEIPGPDQESIPGPDQEEAPPAQAELADLVRRDNFDQELPAHANGTVWQPEAYDLEPGNQAEFYLHWVTRSQEFRAWVRARVRAELIQEMNLTAPPPIQIPRLSAGSVEKYVAAVSKAMARGELDALRARAMLYAAQVVVSQAKKLGQESKGRARGKL